MSKFHVQPFIDSVCDVAIQYDIRVSYDILDKNRFRVFFTDEDGDTIGESTVTPNPMGSLITVEGVFKEPFIMSPVPITFFMIHYD